MLDINDCTAALLAELFDCTPRNIGHYISNGMPVRELGKAGREHRFNAVHSMNWFMGMKICERLGRSLPRTLETTMIGFFSLGGALSGQTFNERQSRARKLAAEMGFSADAYDRAIDFMLSNKLLKW